MPGAIGTAIAIGIDLGIIALPASTQRRPISAVFDSDCDCDCDPGRYSVVLKSPFLFGKDFQVSSTMCRFGFDWVRVQYFLPTGDFGLSSVTFVFFFCRC